ncbi:purine nucleoside phosphorylase [Caldalkalibacillus thermarum]|uniref:purine-nucleoside phosphorylase n=1 Tax=Caldalkalibacillus thermarum TaxID=296745 RepID=UPI00166846E7|nr:purine-nucleoside phosphorylase [Caldalkalibacillus thermarum]GGK15244.1 purine nucleoside phosphorylase [Caldalkalibacillus thermarum]
MGRLTKIKEAAQYIKGKGAQKPEIGLILGSGLGDLAEEIEEAVHIDYGDIPYFPVSTVAGHAGRLVIGRLQGRTVVAMQGRFHYYEGYSMQEVVFPVYVMKQLGVQLLVVTNACGGMNRAYQPGDLMIITDHINFTGNNPLIGPNEEELGPRFPDMSRAYTPELVQFVEETAQKLGIKVQKGVYVGISGPNYMTPAELTMLANLGGDAVGMSTVPEVIAASHTGLKVIGISCVTDMAIGSELEPLTHEQVVEVANRTKPKFISLVKEIVGTVKLS